MAEARARGDRCAPRSALLLVRAPACHSSHNGVQRDGALEPLHAQWCALHACLVRVHGRKQPVMLACNRVRCVLCVQRRGRGPHGARAAAAPGRPRPGVRVRAARPGDHQRQGLHRRVRCAPPATATPSSTPHHLSDRASCSAALLTKRVFCHLRQASLLAADWHARLSQQAGSLHGGGAVRIPDGMHMYGHAGPRRRASRAAARSAGRC